MVVERVGEEDWQVWRDMRLEALRMSPEAFGSSFEDEQHRTEAQWRDNLRRVESFAARRDGAVAGIAVFAVDHGVKRVHRGGLYSVYVRASERGHGLADALVEAVLATAAKQVVQVHLAVVTTNDSAIRLYQRHGFEIYGTEPRSLKVGAQFYDQHLMVRRLD